MEPVTPTLFKQYARLSTDVESDVIELFITAARENAEAYCNRHFVSKTVENTFPANVSCPISADAILSVSGYYTSVEEAANAYQYWVEYVKGSSISRDYPIDSAHLPTYTVRYQAHVDPATVPSAVKVAICKIASDLYENREFYGSHREMGVSAKTLLAPYRVLSK